MLAQFLEGGGLLAQPALRDDVLFPLVKPLHGVAQKPHAFLELFGFAERVFLALPFVHQPVLPLAAVAVGPERRVERIVRGRQAAVHLDHVVLADRKPVGDLLDLLRRQVAFLDGLHLALDLAQVEEQLLLRRRGAHFHQGPRMQHVLLDRRPDPPHGIGGETETAIGVEPPDRLHHADIAFGDELAHRQAVAAIAHGDLGHQAKMAGHQTMGRVHVVVFAPAFGQHVFFLPLQHRELADFLKVPREVPLRGEDAKVGQR